MAHLWIKMKGTVDRNAVQVYIYTRRNNMGNATESILVEYPRELLLSLKFSKDEFAGEFKQMAVIKLYELGKISSSMAAKVLKISRVDFLELLGKYKVSIFPYQSKEELLDDVKNA